MSEVMRAGMRKAIEETSSCIHNSQDWSDPYYADDRGRTLMDQLLDRLVAMASHPADDATPVTAEWLESVGFDPADSFTHDLYPVRVELFGDGTGEAIIGGVIFPHMNTRGDVRRLFAGLKLHLAEPRA